MYHLTVADFTPFWYKFPCGQWPLTLRAFAAAVNQHHWARSALRAGFAGCALHAAAAAAPGSLPCRGDSRIARLKITGYCSV